MHVPREKPTASTTNTDDITTATKTKGGGGEKGLTCEEEAAKALVGEVFAKQRGKADGDAAPVHHDNQLATREDRRRGPLKEERRVRNDTPEEIGGGVDNLTRQTATPEPGGLGIKAQSWKRLAVPTNRVHLKTANSNDQQTSLPSRPQQKQNTGIHSMLLTPPPFPLPSCLHPKHAHTSWL